MRIIFMALTLALCLAIIACSKPTQEKTSADLKAAASEVGHAAKEVATTPEVKAVGSDIKQGAAEAGEKTKEAAGKAGEKLKAAGGDLKEGAQKAGTDLKTSAEKAGDKVEEAAKK